MKSKFLVAWPCNSIDAISVASKFNEKVVCIFGPPSIIVSDSGPCFASKVFNALCNLYGIKLHHGSPYHPQSQGQVERSQKTLISLLRTCVDKNQKYWAFFLQDTVSAINKTESQSTGLTPFLLVFGRMPRSPADLDIPRAYDSLPKSAAQRFVDILASLESAKIFAQEIEESYRAKMKKRYDDSRATGVKLKVGDYTFLHQKEMALKSGEKRKLASSWHGPYLVTEFVGTGTVRLFDCSRARMLKRPVDVQLLKVGYKRKADNPWDPIDPLPITDPSSDLSVDELLKETVIVPSTPVISPRKRVTNTPIVNLTASPQVVDDDTHMSVFLHNRQRQVSPRITRSKQKAIDASAINDQQAEPHVAQPGSPILKQ